MIRNCDEDTGLIKIFTSFEEDLWTRKQFAKLNIDSNLYNVLMSLIIKCLTRMFFNVEIWKILRISIGLRKTLYKNIYCM